MKRFLIIAILFLTTSAFTVVHKFYVSVTQIEYIQKEKALQITTRIFIDDIEQLLRERYDENITLTIENESEHIDTYVKKYISEKLKVKVDGKSVSYNFLGREYEDDIMYCYFEAKKIKPFSKIQVTNTILYDMFPEQQNIVKVKAKGKHKSIILLKDKDKDVLNFN